METGELRGLSAEPRGTGALLLKMIGPAFVTECRAFWVVFWGFICISSDLLPKWQKFTLWYGDCKKRECKRISNSLHNINNNE